MLNTLNVSDRLRECFPVFDVEFSLSERTRPTSLSHTAPKSRARVYWIEVASTGVPWETSQRPTHAFVALQSSPEAPRQPEVKRLLPRVFGGIAGNYPIVMRNGTSDGIEMYRSKSYKYWQIVRHVCLRLSNDVPLNSVVRRCNKQTSKTQPKISRDTSTALREVVSRAHSNPKLCFGKSIKHSLVNCLQLTHGLCLDFDKA